MNVLLRPLLLATPITDYDRIKPLQQRMRHWSLGWPNHKQSDFFSILPDITNQEQVKSSGFSKSKR